MSIDRSLRVKSALVRHRNVLSRAERVEQLKKDEKWAEGDSVFGLQKVAHRKSHAGRKEKAEAVVAPGEEGAVVGAAAAPAAEAGKEAPKGGAKAAAPKAAPAAKAPEQKKAEKKK